MSQQVTVWGAGSWGTTLALVLTQKGHSICLWDNDPEQAKRLSSTRENERFLKGYTLPETIAITTDLQKAYTTSSMHILAIPSHVLRTFLQHLHPYKYSAKTWVSVIKGIEQTSLLRMSQVIGEELGCKHQVACLSGPTHAEEVAQGIPSAIVVASTDPTLSQDIQQLFTTETFRVYTNSDIVGVEIGGSLKNVIALATGIADGLGLGDNSKAAVMTRGLAEISKLGHVLGAKPQTFAGLSGMGDLITTCISKHSRNRHVGERIGRGESLQDIIDSMHMVAEGVKTTQSAFDLAQKHLVDVPIIQEMQQVLWENKSPQQAIHDLLHRPQTKEM